MTSYDRLFPSQDTLPRGGFGNLIALPFQDGPRQAGNSVFLDEGWEPFEDQWGFLASTPLLSAETLRRILADAHRRGGILGLAADGDDEAAEPWMRRPSGRPRSSRIAGPLPRRIEVVVSHRLFVPKEGLPSPFVNRIKRLDALFLTMPISWKGTLIQYVGRLHRRRKGKSEVVVYDYLDRRVPVLARMFEKRLRTYRAMGYEVGAMTDAIF